MDRGESITGREGTSKDVEREGKQKYSRKVEARTIERKEGEENQ